MPSSCSIFAGTELPQAKKKVLGLYTCSRFSHVQLVATLWTVACQASLSEGFSRQDYWSVLANTGCHTLLDHYISCCPSCQLPWVPGADISLCDPSSYATFIPGPNGDKPKSSRAASGANPSGRPTGRGGNKTTIETQGQCDYGRRPKPSHQVYKLQIKSTWSTGQAFCLRNIKKVIESSHTQKKMH